MPRATRPPCPAGTGAGTGCGGRSRIRQPEPATGSPVGDFGTRHHPTHTERFARALAAAANQAAQPATNLRPAELAPIHDDSARRIVGGQRDRDLVAQHDADAVLAQLAAEMGEHLMAVLQLDFEIARRQDLDHAALEFYVFFSTHRGGTEVTR